MEARAAEACLVSVTLKIPQVISERLGGDPDTVARRLLEQAAVEGYRSQELSRGEVAQMLGLDWAETEEFLANHNCERHYSLKDLEKDRENLNRLLGPT
jgi:predicted HTH domain antitoxin